MENEVKNEGQESIDDTIITSAPVVEDVIAEETPAVEAMPAIEPIPAAEPAPAPVEEVKPEPVVEPIVEAIPAAPVPEPAPVEEVVPAPVEAPAPEPAPVVEEVKPAEPVVETPAPAPVEAPVAEPAPVEAKDEVKGVEVNPNTVIEAQPGQSTETKVEQAPAVDLNGGNFKAEAEPKSKANSVPKIIAAVVLLILIILFAFNIDKVQGFITNLNGNTGGVEPTPAPSATPVVVEEETKLTCTKSATDAAGTVTQETYVYTGMGKKLKSYKYTVSTNNTVDPNALAAVNTLCEADKASYIAEAGYTLTCALNGQSAVRTLDVDPATYSLYLAAQTNATPAEGEAQPKLAPAPEYEADANMDDIKATKTTFGFTCE